ncbi:hypothetical protein [Variovorax sp. UMC13]|uniref:hypothetical protein n=1 Tax=Variovorax sp. UMC13 TaxID=1862326 RepID=UPI001C7E535D|nr:hypothetical protein [Variovorax sp. UMC13]MBB1600835.1 hypothetical protein [Variovorax sp. UMC13]
MPMELLHSLKGKPLPVELTDADDIEKLRVLHDAGHVDADIPPWTINLQKPAVVLQITPLGLRAMQYLRMSA